MDNNPNLVSQKNMFNWSMNEDLRNNDNDTASVTSERSYSQTPKSKSKFLFNSRVYMDENDLDVHILIIIFSNSQVLKRLLPLTQITEISSYGINHHLNQYLLKKHPLEEFQGKTLTRYSAAVRVILHKRDLFVL